MKLVPLTNDLAFKLLFNEDPKLLASLIRKQLQEAEAYSLLKPVYQINILNFNLFPTDRYMSKYSLREEEEPDIVLTKDLQMVYFLT